MSTFSDADKRPGAEEYTGAPPARAYVGADFRNTLSRGCKWEQAAVVVCFVAMVVANVLSTASDAFNGQTNKMISDTNPTFVTPDGGTFSIWGFIYAGEAALIIYQAFPSMRKHPLLVPVRRWLLVMFVLNTAWLPTFAYFRWWLGLVVIGGYLYTLWRTYVHMQVDYGGDQSWKFKLFCMTGISFNFAWVLVATLLNLTVVARNSGLIQTVFAPGGEPFPTNTSGLMADGRVVVGGDTDWAVMAIALVGSIAVYRAVRYNDVPYCFTTAWALGGVYRMQTVEENTRFPVVALDQDVANWAVAFIVIVAVAGIYAIGGGIVRSRRAYRQGQPPLRSVEATQSEI